MPVFTVDVGTTPKRILSANPKRIAFMIINDSGYDVYVGFNKDVATSGVNKGVVIAANGGCWAYEYHKGELWAVASGNAEITIVESTEGE